MSKHTPGPWLDWEAMEWIHEPAKLLVEPANARLMAAAPELLAALKRAVCEVERLQVFITYEQVDADECYATAGMVVGRCNAAIAKATKKEKP